VSLSDTWSAGRTSMQIIILKKQEGKAGKKNGLWLITILLMHRGE
jgi:hypothetical protein